MESLLFASQALADAGEAAPMLGQLITQVDPTTTAVWMPGFLEFVAVIAGAVSGALTACDKRLDIVGVCVLALISPSPFFFGILHSLFSPHASGILSKTTP